MKVCKHVFVFIFSLTVCTSKAQNTKHEFGFRTDNDLYVSFYLDEYYTNGLDIYYRFATKNSWKNFNKKISSITIGHKMYNPQYYDIPYVSLQERPYAGYVFTNYSESFISPKHLLTLGVEFGFTGKKTKAEEAQEFVHQFYDMQASDGWDTQIQEKYAFGITASYIKNLYYKPQKKAQLSWINHATIHQIITNISSGLGLRFNLDKNNALTSIDNTSFYNTSLQTDDELWTKECFFGIKSYLTYQLKDYTVTGELNNNVTEKEFILTPWVWHNDLGFYWNLKHWNLSYHQIFHTANIKNMSTSFVRYGSLQVSYKF